MPSTWEPLGPTTVTITVPAGGTAVDFAGEFKNCFILHTYEEVGEARTMLDMSVRGAQNIRAADGFRGDTENDLTAAGLYALLQANDLAVADITITQTASGVSWDGQVSLQLPAEIGADAVGSPIVSSIEWKAGGDDAKFTFTPATATP